MSPDDFRAWVPVAVIVGSQITHVLWLVRSKATKEADLRRDMSDNKAAHNTLTDAVREADRKARAAHSRVDEMETRVTRLEADNENTARTLARSMGSLERALDATNKRIDALLSQLAHNGGHS